MIEAPGDRLDGMVRPRLIPDRVLIVELVCKVLTDSFVLRLWRSWEILRGAMADK